MSSFRNFPSNIMQNNRSWALTLTNFGVGGGFVHKPLPTRSRLLLGQATATQELSP